MAKSRRYNVELIERWQDLESQVAAWDDLAANAVEPNHFYSAGAVLAAMRHLQPTGKPAFLVVRATGLDSPSSSPLWCGFYPFFRYRSYRGAPLRNLRLLKHDYCFLRVPLVRTDCVADVLRVVFDWLHASDNAIVELGDQTGTGLYAEALASLLHGRGPGAWLASSHERAFLSRVATAETYIRTTVSGSKLKELRRQERRLREKGELSFESLSPQDDVDAVIGEFLELERAGWKGAQGTAIACRQAHRDFFAELVRQAWHAEQLQMITLRLAGRPVAMKCNFVAAPGSFAFKIAYAEELSQYSPGVLLELENIRRIHSEPRVEWMDSCAAPGHPMIEHLWKEHRMIQTWIIPLSTWGRVATATLSLMRQFRALVWKPRSTAQSPRRQPAPP